MNFWENVFLKKFPPIYNCIFQITIYNVEILKSVQNLPHNNIGLIWFSSRKFIDNWKQLQVTLTAYMWLSKMVVNNYYKLFFWVCSIG